jgi:hypothetical protein
MSQLIANNGKQSILDSVMGNVGNLIMLRLGAIDSEKMAVYTKPEFIAQDLQELPDFTAVARLLINNTPTRPFVFKTRPMMEPRESAAIEEIIVYSKIRYTFPREKVEEIIIKRRNKYEEIDAGLDEIQKEWDHYLLEKLRPNDVEEESIDRFFHSKRSA